MTCKQERVCHNCLALGCVWCVFSIQLACWEGKVRGFKGGGNGVGWKGREKDLGMSATWGGSWSHSTLCWVGPTF